jgi:peptide/nickel transport system ATP-binding protein
MMAQPPILDVRNLRVEYMSQRGAVCAVDNVSFHINAGEVYGLAGESGCGKSTIALAVLRVLGAPAVITGGQVLFNGEDILRLDDEELEKYRWRDVAMVFQSAMNSLNPVMRIGDQIVDAIQAHERVSDKQAEERGAELLRTVGIDPDRLRSYPHELSGGMRQRAVIAIALALNPPLLIMDEPTTALDVIVQQEIMSQIAELKAQFGFSVLFITHDLSLLVELSDRIGIMYAAQIVEEAPAKELFKDPLLPYTYGLMHSFPLVHGPRRVLSGIPGSPPDLLNPPSGCRFHPRCPLRFEPCPIVLPPLTEVRSGRKVACHLHFGPTPFDTSAAMLAATPETEIVVGAHR